MSHVFAYYISIRILHSAFNTYLEYKKVKPRMTSIQQRIPSRLVLCISMFTYKIKIVIITIIMHKIKFGSF